MVRAVSDWYDGPLPVLGLPGSALLSAAERAGLPTLAEAFADRGYRADGTLVPRSDPGALITDPAEVERRVVAIAGTGVIAATDGTELAVEPASICVHGDTPGAVELAARVRTALESAGVTVRAFATARGS